MLETISAGNIGDERRHLIEILTMLHHSKIKSMKRSPFSFAHPTKYHQFHGTGVTTKSNTMVLSTITLSSPTSSITCSTVLEPSYKVPQTSTKVSNQVPPPSNLAVVISYHYWFVIISVLLTHLAKNLGRRTTIEGVSFIGAGHTDRQLIVWHGWQERKNITKDVHLTQIYGWAQFQLRI